VLLIAVCTPCVARVKIANTSTDPSCPVQITEGFVWASPTLGVERRFEIDFENQTTKVILGANFGLDIMDGVGDFHPYLTDYTVGTKTKVGKKNFNNFFALYTEAGTRVLGTRLYLKKVAFDDGSVWVDDGSKKCSYTKDSR
jgi:hypothetical protein